MISPDKKWQQTRGCGYAPCGSALVITLLQKYRLPLSPSNTTPKTGTHSVETHPQTPPPTCVMTSGLWPSRHPQTHSFVLWFTFIRSSSPFFVSFFFVSSSFFKFTSSFKNARLPPRLGVVPGARPEWVCLPPDCLWCRIVREGWFA